MSLLTLLLLRGESRIGEWIALCRHCWETGVCEASCDITEEGDSVQTRRLDEPVRSAPFASFDSEVSPPKAGHMRTKLAGVHRGARTDIRTA